MMDGRITYSSTEQKGRRRIKGEDAQGEFLFGDTAVKKGRLCIGYHHQGSGTKQKHTENSGERHFVIPGFQKLSFDRSIGRNEGDEAISGVNGFCLYPPPSLFSVLAARNGTNLNRRKLGKKKPFSVQLRFCIFFFPSNGLDKARRQLLTVPLSQPSHQLN